MAIAFVQAAGTNNGAVASTTNVPLAYGSNNGAGHLLVLAGRFSNNGTGTPTSISIADSRNTWVVLQSFVNVNSRLVFAYAANCSAGANTVTVTANGAGANGAFYTFSIAEYSGIATSTPVDKNTTAPGGTTSTSASAGPVTTTIANELLFGWFFNETANGLTLTAGSGYTIRNNPSNAGNGGIEDNIVSATGSYSATMTFSSAVNWGGGIVTFAGASAGNMGWTNRERGFINKRG